MDPVIDYGKCHVPILFTKHLSPTAKILFIWYKFRANSLGVVWWEYADVGNELGLSERTVRRLAAQLEEIGLIRINKSNRRGHEVAVMPFTTEVLKRLAAPTKWMDIRGGSSATNQTPDTDDQGESAAKMSPDGGAEDVDRQLCRTSPANLAYTPGSEVNKTYRKETLFAPGEESNQGVERTPFDEIFNDPLVAKSTQPKEPAKPPRRRPKLEPPPEPGPITDFILGGWEIPDWVRAFVSAMSDVGISVDRKNQSTAIRPQMSNIVNFLKERLSRMEVHEFLIDWLPKNFQHLAEPVFNKDPEALANLPLNLVSSRLGDLLVRFKEHKRWKGVQEKSANEGPIGIDHLF